MPATFKSSSAMTSALLTMAVVVLWRPVVAPLPEAFGQPTC
jgi:hypothetical protein